MEISYKTADTSLSGTIRSNYIKTGNRIFFSCLLDDHQAAASAITGVDHQMTPFTVAFPVLFFKKSHDPFKDDKMCRMVSETKESCKYLFSVLTVDIQLTHYFAS